ncbi:MAG: hypothetical protein V1774_05060 [Candidatus Eisenbacteria bacterium]
MTRERVGQLLEEAVYRVVRRNPPLPSLNEFLDLPLRGLLPESSPRDWPEFWKETLTATIDETFRREGYFIDGLSAKIFLRWNRKMRSVRDWMAERLMPLHRDEAPRAPSSPGMILLALLTALSCPLAAWAAANLAGTTAVLEPTPLERPASGEFAHDIRLAYKSDQGRAVEVPIASACDTAYYALRCDSLPDRPVPIAGIVWRGVARREGHTTGAVLYGRFAAGCRCTLTISLPGFPVARIPVSPAEDDLSGPGKGLVRFVRFIDRHVSGTLDLRTLEEEPNRVGVDLQALVDFPVWRRRLLADAVHCQFEIDGLLAFDREAKRAHNALKTGFCLTWLKHYTPRPAWLGRHVHALGVQLAPIGFESDQNFDVVDYTVGPALTFSLPMVDPLLLAWHRLIEMPRGFLPPTVRIGYTYLHRIRHEEAPRLDDRRRVDAEVVALAPLLRPLDLEARYRIYYDLDTREEDALIELSWKWYVTDDTRTAVLLKLVHGALPPAFREADLVGVGFALGL